MKSIAKKKAAALRKRDRQQARFNQRIAEADACGLSYGKYVAAITSGKTFEELKKEHDDEKMHCMRQGVHV